MRLARSLNVLLTWKRSRAMAVMLIVDTNTLAPEHIGTNLHMKRPSRQAGISTFSRLNGCVNRQKVRSEIARLMMKMFRGVRMAAFRTTTKHTRLLPAAPNTISSANRVIRIVCVNSTRVIYLFKNRNAHENEKNKEINNKFKTSASSLVPTTQWH